jgi:predicted DNA-binding protein with PD1-like motif
MNVVESRRIRHLVVRADRGEELPAALVRALDEAEARAGTVTGHGMLEAAEIVDASHGSPPRAHRIESPVTVAQLTGNVAIEHGATNVRLFVTLVRESELGVETFAGQLVWARALSLDLVVTAFDDLLLARMADERTGVSVLHAAPRGQVAAMRSPTPPPPAAAAAPEPVVHVRPSPLAAPVPGEAPQAIAPPARPARHQPETAEVYPETGDLVSHFHFGECEVLSSDGERIRLRQEKDGRVREVSLAMLKIESPTVDPASGKRHFKLARKH